MSKKNNKSLYFLIGHALVGGAIAVGVASMANKLFPDYSGYEVFRPETGDRPVVMKVPGEDGDKLFVEEPIGSGEYITFEEYLRENFIGDEYREKGREEVMRLVYGPRENQ